MADGNGHNFVGGQLVVTACTKCNAVEVGRLGGPSAGLVLSLSPADALDLATRIAMAAGALGAEVPPLRCRVPEPSLN